MSRQSLRALASGWTPELGSAIAEAVKTAVSSAVAGFQNLAEPAPKAAKIGTVQVARHDEGGNAVPADPQTVQLPVPLQPATHVTPPGAQFAIVKSPLADPTL